MTQPLPQQRAGLHPMLWVAAISVTALSAVGIAAITGVLPGSHAATQEASVASTAANTTPATPVTPQSLPAAPAPVVKSTTPAPVAAKPLPQKEVHKEVVEARPATVYSTRRVSSNNDIEVYRSDTQNERVADSQPRSASASCNSCGLIESVNAITEKGEGSGLGAIAGGVVGGIIGNQIGGGHGRDLARIAGIAGGAYAGHEIEKRQRARTTYEVNVRLEDGSLRTFKQESQPNWQAGDRVKIEDGTLIRR